MTAFLIHGKAVITLSGADMRIQVKLHACDKERDRIDWHAMSEAEGTFVGFLFRSSSSNFQIFVVY